MRLFQISEVNKIKIHISVIKLKSWVCISVNVTSNYCFWQHKIKGCPHIAQFSWTASTGVGFPHFLHLPQTPFGECWWKLVCARMKTWVWHLVPLCRLGWAVCKGTPELGAETRGFRELASQPVHPDAELRRREKVMCLRVPAVQKAGVQSPPPTYTGRSQVCVTPGLGHFTLFWPLRMPYIKIIKRKEKKMEISWGRHPTSTVGLKTIHTSPCTRTCHMSPSRSTWVESFRACHTGLTFSYTAQFLEICQVLVVVLPLHYWRLLHSVIDPLYMPCKWPASQLVLSTFVIEYMSYFLYLVISMCVQILTYAKFKSSGGNAVTGLHGCILMFLRNEAVFQSGYAFAFPSAGMYDIISTSSLVSDNVALLLHCSGFFSVWFSDFFVTQLSYHSVGERWQAGVQECGVRIRCVCLKHKNSVVTMGVKGDWR